MTSERRQTEAEISGYFKDLYYTCSGEGPPIIALHGLGATSFSWRRIRSILQAQNTLYLFDLRGHGNSRSCYDYSCFSLEAQANSIAEFIRTKNLHRAVLVGHSMGGGVALLTALQLRQDHDCRLDALILIDSIGFIQKLPLFFRLLRFPRLARCFAFAFPHTWLVRWIMRKAFYDKNKISREAISAYAANLNRPQGINELIATADRLIPGNINELALQFSDITLPVLLIWGKNDKFVPPYVAISLTAVLGNSQLEVIDNCGHLPQEECPEAIGPKIVEFLRGLDRAHAQ